MVSEEAALQVAVTAFPLIALVATFAVDSVGENDRMRYRIIVLVLGLSAVATVAPAIFTGLIGATSDVDTSALLLNLGESVGFVLLLTIAVMLKESLRGEEDGKRRIIILFVTFIGLIVVLQILLPSLESLFGL